MLSNSLGAAARGSAGGSAGGSARGSTGGNTAEIVSREESPLLLAVDQALESPNGEPPSAEVRIAETGMIVIDGEDYARVVDRIWDDPHRFSGRSVEMISFVFRRPQWPRDLFTAARLSIWCCAADAAVIGLLVESDPRDTPRDDEWIRIRGTLGVMDSFDTGTNLMENVPILREVSWEVVPRPDFEYVFPADW